MTLKAFLALAPSSIPKTKMVLRIPKDGDIICGWASDEDPTWWYWYTNKTLTNRAGNVINSSWIPREPVWLYREAPANPEWGEESP